MDVFPQLNRPQGRFLSMPHKFRSFVAGFGSGKTWVGCCSLLLHFARYQGVNAGYFAPTYPQIRDIFYPTMEECAEAFGLTAVVRMGSQEVDIYYEKNKIGTILCRSMTKPGSIIGFKIGHGLVDEIDTLPTDKARDAWRKILARMRYKVDGLRNGIDVTTTPEGFGFVYEMFQKLPREKEELRELYGLVQASTYDNETNLPPDYIPSLLASYPPQLVDAYINGRFVNMHSGSVYCAFDDKENAGSTDVTSDEPFFIGMDFNVGKMAAVVHVKRNGLPVAIDEIVNAYDTPDMIRIIQERYWKYEKGRWQRTRQIRVYPDASGGSRKSVNASESDISLLRQAGFVICCNPANPPVKDRVNAMNAMFCNANGERRYFVNTDRCPSYTEALRQQAWAQNGEPNKVNGYDHICDAGGYFIAYDYPVRTRNAYSGNISMR